MTTPGYYNSGKKLEEGMIYLFKVIGLVTLQDEQTYFILEDPYHIRHLLTCRYYDGYGINAGQEILCKVDKINCTGCVYLEPEHPHYKVGQVYEFRFRSVLNNTQSTKISLIVADEFDNEISVDLPAGYNFTNKDNGKVLCKLLKVRKGKPLFTLTKDSLVKKDMFSGHLKTNHIGK
jgi:hypothetical protein